MLTQHEPSAGALAAWESRIRDAAREAQVTVENCDFEYEDSEQLSPYPGHPCGDVPVSVKVSRVVIAVKARLECRIEIECPDVVPWQLCRGWNLLDETHELDALFLPRLCEHETLPAELEDLTNCWQSKRYFLAVLPKDEGTVRIVCHLTVEMEAY